MFITRDVRTDGLVLCRKNANRREETGIAAEWRIILQDKIG